MPDGGTLIVRTRDVEADEVAALAPVDMRPGPAVELSVSDNGTGMSADILSRIFEPFFTTKEVGRGTGLGLATCYGIVREFDGHIGPESAPGKGTTFRVLLPRSTRAAEAHANAAPSAAAPRGDETLLVIEDNDLVREATVRALRDQGYDVLVAAAAPEALAIAREAPRRIDLVIVDVVLPRMSGPEVAAEIVRLSPSTRKLFVSGQGRPITARRLGTEDEEPILLKPFTPAELGHKIREILDRDGLNRPS